MTPHVAQVNHNENFHACICENYTDQFFDWKITVLFYCAYHCLKALAEHKRIDIGSRHHDIEHNVNPKFTQTQKRQKGRLQISKTAWTNYNSLSEYSRTARYEGILDPELFEELKREDYDRSLKHLADFKLYVKGQGVKL